MTKDSPEPEGIDIALLAGLTTKAGDLENRLLDLIETVRINRVARTYLVLLTVLLLAGSGVVIWTTQVTRHNTGVIIDCTDPSGKCYKEARQSAKDNVQLINQISVAAAYCAHQPENKTLEQIKACVSKSVSHD